MSYQIIDSRFVASHLADVPLIDVRPHSMYVQGHVPHAINIPYDQIKMATVGADGPAESLATAQLMAQKFKEAGIFPYTEVMVMCQIGRTATFAVEMLSTMGYNDLLLYKGSYTDWASVPSHRIVDELDTPESDVPSAAAEGAEPLAKAA